MNKLFKKNSELLPERVIVRPYTSWRTRMLVIFLFCSLLLMLSWGMYEAGRRTAGVVDAASLTKLSEPYHVTTCLQKKRTELCTQLAELTRQFQIVQTTNEDLAKQTRLLSKENNRLKEELDFFEHVMSGNTKIDNGISIHQFSLKKDAQPGVYRYSVSMVQGGQRPKDFHGSLKFFVNLRQKDQRKTVLLANKEAEQSFAINFKFYHRIEESFRVPPDAIVESMKVQVFEQNDAQAKLTQTAEPM
ncbi:DUF6776 family protein [Nitrosomonas sp.]|uniref:DUF6776 family protein n=1 Tax=Nitrosomonas sp. TaxID=42353 RepID=UPI001D7C8973|nr:DUF6776 family protein [Nitrosomonas sp.]MCB1949815.1 hypothetical protein [Nitrosomonas sp.]MCP5242857.1 hypothetical protein [Burkholderiales bacterium]MDR4514389.1 hypothetical protein [Nitrosomonas sp.]